MTGIETDALGYCERIVSCAKGMRDLKGKHQIGPFRRLDSVAFTIDRSTERAGEVYQALKTWKDLRAAARVVSGKGNQISSGGNTEIEDHAGEHDWETQMQVELVESERRLQPARPVSHLMQYLLNQHYQQMRAAFPEIYPPEGVNGITAAEEPNTPTPNEDESHALELHQDLSAELDLSVNGYAT